ncbi:MAG: hypothetical protein ACLRPS_10705 [Paraprevotella clara]|uniref:Uncharacterized protein n=1 Tax=Paraprevotella clara TaxID=454154 RepID=A0A6N2ZSV4_9BACT
MQMKRLPGIEDYTDMVQTVLGNIAGVSHVCMAMGRSIHTKTYMKAVHAAFIPERIKFLDIKAYTCDFVDSDKLK